MNSKLNRNIYLPQKELSSITTNSIINKDNDDFNYNINKENEKCKNETKIVFDDSSNSRNLNLANINNANIIETKNTVNNVKKIYKNNIEEKNNNIIFDNHFMVPGLVETSKLTGLFFFFK